MRQWGAGANAAAPQLQAPPVRQGAGPQDMPREGVLSAKS